MPPCIDQPGDSVFERAHWRSRGTLEEIAGGRGTVAFIRERRPALGAAPLSSRRTAWPGSSTTPTCGPARIARAASPSGACCDGCASGGCRCRGPSPLATRASGSRYRADLITEELPSRRRWPRRLRPAPLRAATGGPIGRCVGTLHAHGVHHADLNAHNLLLGAAASGVRARLRPRPHRAARQLGAGGARSACTVRSRRSRATCRLVASTRRSGVRSLAGAGRGTCAALLYVLLIYLLAPIVIAHRGLEGAVESGVSRPPAPAARLRAAAGAARMPLGARGVGGRGAGGGRADPRTASPRARPRRRAHDGHADRRAAGEGAVQGTSVRHCYLPYDLPGSVRPIPGPDLSRRWRSSSRPRSGPRSITSSDGGGFRWCWQRARFDALGRPLSAHGVAVPRDAVARHPDRRADAGRRRAVSRDRRAPGPRAASPATSSSTWRFRSRDDRRGP